jgi:beta-N-acetylhexosaminidase
MSVSSDLRHAAGELIVGGLDGTELPEEVAAALRARNLGGVILFRRNIVSAEQVVALTDAVHACRPGDAPALPVAVDQEGGRVARLRGLATDFPPAAWLGALGDADLCARAGEAVAAELSALGFNVDFAPVMDVDTEPDNPVIGDRSFGADAREVARLAGAFALGLLVGGVAPCAKHFPGHGDTRVDSHVDLPVVPHSLARLEALEWVPFAAAVRAGLPMIMTAHLVVTALDPDRPATFSPRVLHDHLRGRLGFKGVIVSDDLEMAAVAERYTVEEMGPLGLRAGVDLFLVCHRRDRQEALLESLIRAAERDVALRERLRESAFRVRRLRRDYLRIPPAGSVEQWPDVVGCSPHRALADEIRRRYADRAGGPPSRS